MADPFEFVLTNNTSLVQNYYFHYHYNEDPQPQIRTSLCLCSTETKQKGLHTEQSV